MKALLVIIAGIVILFMAFRYPNVDFANDPADGIQFHKGSWTEALNLAKKENKLIFLDIYATWCGPCKRLKSTTFSNIEVGEFYNQTFINVAMDGEKGEGPWLANKYNIKGYPSLLFIDSNGNIVAGTSGYHNVKNFLELGARVIKNNNSK